MTPELHRWFETNVEKYVRPRYRSDVMTVIELGSRNVNGTLRDLFPASFYLGIDKETGPMVDLKHDITALHFLRDSFWDVVVCTETIEHVKLWSEVVYRMKNLVRPGGFVLLSSPGPRFPRHEYPEDHWRFTPEHFVSYFSNFHMHTCKVIPVGRRDYGITAMVAQRPDVDVGERREWLAPERVQ